MPRKTSSYKTQGQPAKKDTQEEEGVKKVVQKFKDSWDYTQSNYHPRWENAYKLYNNRRVKQGYEGISNVFVPVTFSTIETMVSALAGGKPSFDYIPPQSKPEQNTEILNSLIDSFWDKDQWNIKVQNFIRAMLVYGTGIAYLMWDIDHPVMVNIAPRDFWFDPNAVNFENAPKDFYCGRRYLTTLEELKSFEVIDTDIVDELGNPTGETKKKYKIPDDIHGGTNVDTDDTDKATKDMFYGSTAPNPENTQVEVLEMWTEDRVYSVLNRSFCIEDEENPYKTQHRRVLEARFIAEGLKEAEAKKKADIQAKGIIPFIIQRDYIDESLLLGKGEVDVFADLQEDLNDFTNQKRDFFSFILNPMWALHPDYADQIEQVGAVPGRVFPYEPNKLSPIDMPSFPNSAFNEEIGIENKIREATGIDQVVKGVNTSTQTTATEVNAQIASAGQRIGMKVTQIENEGFHRLARIVFEMVKLYVNEPMMVRIVGKDGVRWDMFDPNEFEGEYEPRVQLQSTVNAQKQGDVMEAKEIYLALAGDPSVNQDELKKIMLPKMFDLDPDEVTSLLAKPDLPEGMPMEGMTDPSLPVEGLVTPESSMIPEEDQYLEMPL